MAVILRVRSTLSYGAGAPGLQTFYFLPGTAGGAQADADDVVDRVQDWWNAVDALFTSGFEAQVDSAVDTIEATNGALTGSLATTPMSPVAGTGGGALLPVASMVLLQLLTGDVHAGRRVRGRSYIGPVSTTVNNAGVPSVGARNLVISSAAALVTGPTASAHVVWSRPDSPPGDPGFHSEVTGYGCWSSFAVLRSRRD